MQRSWYAIVRFKPAAGRTKAVDIGTKTLSDGMRDIELPADYKRFLPYYWVPAATDFGGEAFLTGLTIKEEHNKLPEITLTIEDNLEIIQPMTGTGWPVEILMGFQLNRGANQSLLFGDTFRGQEAYRTWAGWARSSQDILSGNSKTLQVTVRVGRAGEFAELTREFSTGSLQSTVTQLITDIGAIPDVSLKNKNFELNPRRRVIRQRNENNYTTLRRLAGKYGFAVVTDFEGPQRVIRVRDTYNQVEGKLRGVRHVLDWGAGGTGETGPGFEESRRRGLMLDGATFKSEFSTQDGSRIVFVSDGAGRPSGIAIRSPQEKGYEWFLDVEKIRRKLTKANADDKIIEVMAQIERGDLRTFREELRPMYFTRRVITTAPEDPSRVIEAPVVPNPWWRVLDPVWIGPVQKTDYSLISQNYRSTTRGAARIVGLETSYGAAGAEQKLTAWLF